MNLDLIKKLTKLANNNPNEHEANLAARKVCLLLEEGKFLLDAPKTRPTIRTASNPVTYNDWFKNYWTEAGWDARERPKPKEEESQGTWTGFRKDPFAGSPKWNPIIFEYSEEPIVKAVRECMVCRKFKEMENPKEVLFVCKECNAEIKKHAKNL